MNRTSYTLSAAVAAVCACVLCLVTVLPLHAQDRPREPRQRTPALKPTLRTAYDTAQALSRLRTQIEALYRTPAFASTTVGIAVRSVVSGATLYESNATTPLTPASNTKLFSTLAVFHALGPDGVIATEVRSRGRIDASGTLKGDLYLIGRGDAMLTVADLETIADELFALGLRRVEGTIYGDGSWFDDVTNRAVYSGDFEDVVALPPVTALAHTGGQIAVVVSSTSKGYITVSTIPASDAIIVRHATKRSARRRAIRVSSTTDADGRQVLTVSGSPGANTTRTVYVAAKSPALIAAGTLSNRLQSGGIVHVGKVSVGKAPSEARALAAYERPFLELASVVNKRSHNLYAEHVFKIAGALYGGQVNTAAKARWAMLATLDSLRVDRSGAVFNDGSGLSRRNLVSARTETDMLCAVHRQPYFNAYYASLAIAGVDGSLRRRMIGSAAQGNVHAKTGTLRNVSSLGGYVTTRDGDLLAFSIISNGPRTDTYKSVENVVAILLAGFSYNPPAAADPNAAPLMNVEPASPGDTPPVYEGEERPVEQD